MGDKKILFSLEKSLKFYFPDFFSSLSPAKKILLKKILRERSFQNAISVWEKHLISQQLVDKNWQRPTRKDIDDKKRRPLALKFATWLVDDFFCVHVKDLGFPKKHFPKKTLFVCNHPCGAIDGLALLCKLYKTYGDAAMIANAALRSFFYLAPAICPVNVFYPNQPKDLKPLISAMKSPIPLLSFPAGKVARKINGRVSDSKWNSSFLNSCLRYKRNLVLVHIDAENSAFFYNTATIRKFLRIQSNLEMLWLPYEFFNSKKKNITMRFSSLITPKHLYDMLKVRKRGDLELAEQSKNQEKIAEAMRVFVENTLSNNPGATFKL